MFAHIKVLRRADRFLRRGLAACRSEWRLLAATPLARDHALRNAERFGELLRGPRPGPARARGDEPEGVR